MSNLSRGQNDGSLENSLDEGITLLSLLNPQDQCSSLRKVAQIGSSKKTARWILFLDHLCWLCDPEPGGKTVASTAVQKTSAGSKFWLASNNGRCPSVERHFKWLLGTLCQLVKGLQTEREVFNQVFTRSVSFSHKRISEYSEKLNSFASHVRRLKLDGDPGNFKTILRCRNC
jgi:hypothetical protein